MVTRGSIDFNMLSNMGIRYVNVHELHDLARLTDELKQVLTEGDVDMHDVSLLTTEQMDEMDMGTVQRVF